MNTNAIVPGSLSAISRASGKSLAETFTSCDVILIIDLSGSMCSEDSRGGRSRYEVACEELARVQNSMPGKSAVIGFSDDATFCPSGVPVMIGGGTNMGRALEFCKLADLPGMQFVLISDGRPDNESRTLEIARTFQNKIHTIFVGPEDDRIGRDFLARLAAATGGKTALAEKAKELADGIEKLLLTSG